MEKKYHKTLFFISKDGKTLYCEGDWTILNSSRLQPKLKAFAKSPLKLAEIDVSKITNLDSAGVILLQDFLDDLKQNGSTIKIVGLSEKNQSIYDFVLSETESIHQQLPQPVKHHWFYVVGEWSVDKHHQLLRFLAFVGEFAATLFRAFFQPKRFQLRSILTTIQTTGYQAMPIVGLMAFLVGIVLAYQLITQLKAYGADIYVVDLTGIGMLREFAPLITAVIIAGRTSTSFAALIGTMKVNEEIDALETIGLSPIERLVLPKVIGLIIALPLLVVWADFFGVFGGMVMSKNSLDIGFHAFLERFKYAVQLKHYVLGLVKVPVFALIIAAVGCFQGFQVSMSAESVGRQTTKAAVQSIFLIIIADAAFSILYDVMGL